MGKRITLDDWAIGVLAEAAREEYHKLSYDIGRLGEEIEYYQEKFEQGVSPLLPDPDGERQAIGLRIEAATRYRDLKVEDAKRYEKLLNQLGTTPDHVFQFKDLD